MQGIEIPAYYLVNPLGKQHIKLSFSHDVRLAKITTQGQYDSIELFYTRLNEKLRYDDHTVFDLAPSADGTFAVGRDEDLTSILISADFAENADRKITLTLEKAEVRAQ